MDDCDLEIADDVAHLRINRPQARNAISLAMWETLPGLLAAVVRGGRARLIVLRGAGTTFSSGADIEEFASAYATQTAALANHACMQAAMAALEACPLPTIAALEGGAYGAALALAVCCDLRIAAPDCRMAITPAKLGLLYAYGDVIRLAALIGPGKAKLLLLTARAIDAKTALDWGLIDEIAHPSLDGALGALVGEMLAGAPSTQAGLKRLFAQLRAGQREENDESRALFANAFQGRDFQEGYLAFKQKRTPRFAPPQRE